MKEFFSFEGPLISFLDKCGRVVILSVLWTFCSLPLITLGASSTALYYSITKTVRKDRSSSVKEFFKSFRRSFKRSLPFTLLLILCAAVLYVDIVVWSVKKTRLAFVSMNVCIVLAALLIAFSGFLFPVISRFILGFKETLKFAAFLTFRHLPVSLVLIVLAFILAAGTWSFILNLLYLPGVLCLIASAMIEKILKNYIPKPEEGEEVWYDE